MAAWWLKQKRRQDTLPAKEKIRAKYGFFRELLSLNNECLELLAGLQEDLQNIPPLRDVIGERVSAIFNRAEGTVAALGKLTGGRFSTLTKTVQSQRREVESYIAARQELATPRLSAWLSEVDMSHAEEVGGKAAALGEIKKKLGLPVPNGYVLTTEAYRQFCGVPLWRQIRDALHKVDIDDMDALAAISMRLRKKIMEQPVPRILEIAVTERGRTLAKEGQGLAVRSSAVGEGGRRSFAGQFISIINVPPDRLISAYKSVVAGRFSERAIFYRFSAGLSEVESPIAVLFLPVIRARASGIMYTRDPKDPKSDTLWITATVGLGLDIASGISPTDLHVVSRHRSHVVLERSIARKEQEIVVADSGGVTRRAITQDFETAPSVQTEDLQILADWGVRIEQHFGRPQDIEWALDDAGRLWILQSRPLVLAEPPRVRSRAPGEPLITGGRTVYPGRVSGSACLVDEWHSLSRVPYGAIVFLRRASPEIVQVLPRIAGLAAEWGNITGHAAALLREFKIASVFEMQGAFDHIRDGDSISLDAIQANVYRGTLWSRPKLEVEIEERYRGKSDDPINRKLLTLNLVDPSAFNFRPSGCKSTHDVLRFCHEKAIEVMFSLNDSDIGRGIHSSKRLLTPMPINLYVLDIGGGLSMENPEDPEVSPVQIVSRPFQGLWKGVTHPGVTWIRKMPASFSDLASVMAGSFSSHTSAVRALGEKSYLMVADEYMNLNSRLAYHFTLLDACLSDNPGNNYISFRFAGGGATRQRRNLRACFIESCLGYYGFLVDRRGDLVNAWLKKAPAEEMDAKLDILGRLMACTSQLDMYMTSHDVMKWYVRQFLEGNYGFNPPEDSVPGEGNQN